MKTTLKLPCPRHRAISQPHQSAAFASPPPRQLLKHPFRRSPLSRTPLSARSFAQRHENYSKTSMSTASRHLATAPKHRIRQPPSTSQTCFPPLSRTALLRADTRASPRVILNLPQARHMPPRRLVMPTAAGRRRFHWRPFPASRIPAPTPKRRIRQFPANFSSTLPAAPLPRTALFRADTRASPRAILNLPQARHTSPRRLVMPTAAGRRRFHWRPFPASRIPAPTPKRRMRQPTANFSNTVSVATPLRGQPLSAQTYAPRHGTPLKSPWPR